MIKAKAAKGVKASAVALLVTGLLGSSLAIAEGPHDKAIKARQAMFQLYSYNIGLLSGMAKGKIDYNADIASEAAENLRAAAHLGQSTLWPAGSDNGNSDNARTRALPAIWETFPAITEKADALKTASTALAATAGNGLNALKAGIGDVGASCKGCHDDYRAKKK